MRLILGCLAFAVLLGSARAQLPFDPTIGTTIDWPAGSWGGGTVTRVLTGDFTGDLYRDLVLLDGDELVLAFGPAVFTARSPLGDGVVDACALPGAAPGGFDGLFASDILGWRRTWIDYTMQPSVRTSAVVNEDWAEAQSLQLLSTNGPPSVVALDAAGTRVLRLTDPFGSPSSSEILSLGSVVGLALAVVDWNSAGAPELAVLHDEGLDVYDIASPSTPIKSFTLASPSTPLEGGALVAFRQAGRTAGRLAAVIEPAAAPAELWVFDAVEVESGPLETGTPAVAVSEPYGLAAGDLDGDESDELVVAHRDPDIDGPVIYSNLCTGAGSSCVTFDGASADVPSLGIPWTDPSGQEAVPVFDDFTSDGDVDLAWFQQDATLLRLAENTTSDHTEQLVHIRTEDSVVLIDEADEVGLYRARFLPPATALSFTPNTIWIEQWYQYTPAEMHGVGVQVLAPAYSTAWSALVPLWLWPVGMPMDGVTHLTIRAALTDTVTGTLLQAGPASVHSIALTVGTASYLDGFLALQGVNFQTLPVHFRDLTVPVGGVWLDFPLSTFVPQVFEGGGGGSPQHPPPTDDDDPPVPPPSNP